MRVRDVVLDVDVGIDDALMMLSLLSDARVRVVAIGSTHGNCRSGDAARNALRVLEACGIDSIPVALGAESPLAAPRAAPEVHGFDGLGDLGLAEPAGTVTGEQAADQLIRLSAERPQALDLIAVGALTNLSLALDRDSAALARFRSITYLGGLSGYPAPVVPDYYDANVAADPAAAAALFSSDVPVTVVPIDLSRRAALQDHHLESIRHGTTPQARFAWQILPFYCDFYAPRLGRWSAAMHDPLAAALLVDPGLAISEVERPMLVEPYAGFHRAVGQSEPGAGTAGLRPARIITDASLDRFLDEFTASLLGPLTAPSPAAAPAPSPAAAPPTLPLEGRG